MLKKNIAKSVYRSHLRREQLQITQFSQAPQTTQISKSANTAKRLAILKVLAGNVPLPIAIGQLLWKSRKNHPRAQSSVKHLDVFVSQLIIYQHTLCLSNYSSRLQLQNSLRIKIINLQINVSLSLFIHFILFFNLLISNFTL